MTDPLRSAAIALRERLDIDPGNVRSWAEWDDLDDALIAAPAEGLDVERLARAIRIVEPNAYSDDPTFADVIAAEIALEYAALEGADRG